MAETMIGLAIDSIPLLVQQTGKLHVSKDRINSYIFNLKKKRKTAVERLADDFYDGKHGNTINLQEFTIRFTKKDEQDYSKLSTAFGTRLYLNWIFANTPDEVYAKGAGVFASLLDSKASVEVEELKPTEEEKSSTTESQDEPDHEQTDEEKLIDEIIAIIKDRCAKLDAKLDADTGKDCNVSFDEMAMRAKLVPLSKKNLKKARKAYKKQLEEVMNEQAEAIEEEAN